MGQRVLSRQDAQNNDKCDLTSHWGVKQKPPTFSDTLAFVRQQLWPVRISWLSGTDPDVVIIPKVLFERLTDTLAFAA